MAIQKKFKSSQDLKKGQLQLNRVLGRIVESIALEVLRDWKDLLIERIYEEDMLKKDPDNDYYERTGEIVEALSIRWLDSLTCELYYDTSLIHANFTSKTHFNQHSSFKGQDISEFMPEMIEEGQSSSVYSYEGIHAHADIVEVLEEEFYAMLKKELIKRGIL